MFLFTIYLQLAAVGSQKKKKKNHLEPTQTTIGLDLFNILPNPATPLLSSTKNSMERKRRVRSATFSDFEADLLLRLVDPQKELLLGSRPNRANLELKNDAWQTVADKFNAASEQSEYRTVETLKKKYYLIRYVKKKAEDPTLLKKPPKVIAHFHFVANPVANKQTKNVNRNNKLKEGSCSHEKSIQTNRLVEQRGEVEHHELEMKNLKLEHELRMKSNLSRANRRPRYVMGKYAFLE